MNMSHAGNVMALWTAMACRPYPSVTSATSFVNSRAVYDCLPKKVSITSVDISSEPKYASLLIGGIADHQRVRRRLIQSPHDMRLGRPARGRDAECQAWVSGRVARRAVLRATRWYRAGRWPASNRTWCRSLAQLLRKRLDYAHQP